MSKATLGNKSNEPRDLQDHNSRACLSPAAPANALVILVPAYYEPLDSLFPKQGGKLIRRHQQDSRQEGCAAIHAVTALSQQTLSIMLSSEHSLSAQNDFCTCDSHPFSSKLTVRLSVRTPSSVPESSGSGWKADCATNLLTPRQAALSF